MKLKLLIACFLFLTAPPAVFAYLDEVLMTPEEVWTASKTVLQSTGIAVENKETYQLQGKWIEDYVRKEKDLLPKGMGRSITLPSTVRRRYQMRVQLKELPTGTQIQVSGKYQERPVSAPEHQARWRYVKPSTEDYELERILFFKILRELARVRISQG